MADVKVALDELREESESSSIESRKPLAAKRPAVRSNRWLFLGAISLLLIGLALGAYTARTAFRAEPLTFQRLTFRRGDVTAAKFGPGDAIVYSAEWDGAPSTLFSTQPGNREARNLGLPAGKILSISHTGEMAILLGGDGPGTLARVPFSGGAPRELLENVSAADWSPEWRHLSRSANECWKTSRGVSRRDRSFREQRASPGSAASVARRQARGIF